MTASQNDVVRITAVMEIPIVGVIENVYHVRITSAGPIDDTDLQDAAAEFLEDIYTEINSRISDEQLYNSINIFNYTNQQVFGSISWPSLTAGLNTGDLLAPGVSALAIGRTGVSRRVGRKYFGVFTEDSITDGFFSAATIVDIADAAEIAYGPYTATNGVEFEGGVYDRVNIIFRTILDVTATGNPAYQRRRRQGTGI